MLNMARMVNNKRSPNEIFDALLEQYPSFWGTNVPTLDQIGQVIRNRTPRYATKTEVATILSWKRHPTAVKFIHNNSHDQIQHTTLTAFKSDDIADTIDVLTSCDYVGTAMASAILRFVDPQAFAIVDWRNWYVLSHPTNIRGDPNILFRQPVLPPLRNPFSSSEITASMYAYYMKIIRHLAQKYPHRTPRSQTLAINRELRQRFPHRTPAEIDMSLFSYSWKYIKKPHDHV